MALGFGAQHVALRVGKRPDVDHVTRSDPAGDQEDLRDEQRQVIDPVASRAQDDGAKSAVRQALLLREPFVDSHERIAHRAEQSDKRPTSVSAHPNSPAVTTSWPAM